MLQILQNIGSHAAICLCVVCKAQYRTNDKYFAKKTPAGDQCHACRQLPRNPPTQTLLLQVYDYDPLTGALTYKREFDRRKKGELATTNHIHGYLMVHLDKSYLAHRMIWLMQTGGLPECVDHINHIRTDNTWSNLRDATNQVNAQNKSINKNNTSGFLGVSYMPKLGKFRATLTTKRKSVHLGLFHTAEAAHQARLNANQQYTFHENHGTHQ